MTNELHLGNGDAPTSLKITTTAGIVYIKAQHLSASNQALVHHSSESEDARHINSLIHPQPLYVNSLRKKNPGHIAIMPSYLITGASRGLGLGFTAELVC